MTPEVNARAFCFVKLVGSRGLTKVCAGVRSSLTQVK